MSRLEQIQAEIAVLKEKYWECINMHRPNPSVFKKRELLDDLIAELERIEADIITIELNK